MRTDLYNYFPANDHRKSLVFLQVGFNSMGYEERKQKRAYDETSLLGKFFYYQKKCCFAFYNSL